MFDHVEIKVANCARSTAFYSQSLEPLGIKVLLESKSIAGFGTGLILGADNHPRVEFLIESGGPQNPLMHLAFKANSRACVDQFYARALAAGGRDNGAPGLRVEYHPNYYAAFVFDPDGHNVEAVYHGG